VSARKQSKAKQSNVMKHFTVNSSLITTRSHYISPSLNTEEYSEKICFSYVSDIDTNSHEH
jgi:hypothetical protein